MAYMPGFGTPEDQLKITEAERRRKFADALRTQQQPQGQMIGQVYVAPSWTQRLSTLLQNYQGGQMGRQADQEIKDVAANRQKTMTDANQALIEALKPKQQQVGETSAMPAYTPEQMDRFGSPQPGVQRQPVVTPQFKTVNPTPQDIISAQLQYAQSIGDPNAISQATSALANYGVQQQNREDTQSFQKEQTAAQREYLKAQAEESRQQRMQEIMLKMQDSRLQAQDRASLQRELAQMAQEGRMQVAQLAAGNRAPVAVQGPDGNAMYVQPNQAIGQRPYTAKQEAAEAIKAQQNEQSRISAQQVLDQADSLSKHPGREMGTGFSSFMSAIPGTDAMGFKSNLDTFKAQTFVPMVSALKGMGALSDAEGKKLSESVGALNPSMPEKEFQDSLKNVTRTLYQKAKASGLNVSLPDFAAERAEDKKSKGASGGWSITPVGK